MDRSSGKTDGNHEAEYHKKINAMNLEIADLRKRIIALEMLITRNGPPVDMLSIREKARIMREAHATGLRSEIIKATRLINGLPTHKSATKRRTK